MKWNLFAGMIGDTGYSAHGRGLARALIRKQVDLAIENSGIGMGNELGQPVELVDASKKVYPYERTIMISFPEYWGIKSGDRLPAFIGYGVWEGDRISNSWEAHINRSKFINEIWVPSEHTKKAFSVVDKPIHVVPHGVDPDIYKINRAVKKHDEFTFVYVGGWKDGEKDRKGMDIAMRAFCAEFKKGEKVRMICKVNMAYQDPRTVLENIQKLNLPSPDTRADIQVFMQNTSEKDLAVLYQMADVFVAPYKADAFNMSVAESMACGAFPIATRFGGPEDYMETGAFIDGPLIPSTGGMMYEGVKWMQPDQKQLQDTMRDLFQRGRERIEKLGEDASKHIRENYSWEKSAEKALERMKTYEG
jgi:glycosyltransferase involved in cell wall biosynthesis